MADEERLVFALEARIRDFEKNFAKAHATANKRLTAIEKRAEQSAANMRATFANAGVSINALFNTLGGAGILAGGGLAGLAATIKSTASSVSDLHAEAQKAGIAFESFQELKYAAEQNKVSVDALSDGLKEMQLRADEFTLTGKGSSAEAFQRLGYSAEELKKKLQDPVSLFEEIIDKIGQFDKAAQIRLSDEIFGGTGGEQFVRFLQQGQGGIARMRKEARDLGVVLTDEVAAKAQEIDREFSRLGSQIEAYLKTGVVEAASALKDYKAEIIAIAAAMGALATGATLGPLAASIASATASAAGAARGLTTMNATILTVAAGQRVATLATTGLTAALRLLGGPWGIAITALVGTIAYLATKQDAAKKAAEDHQSAMSALEVAIAKARAGIPGAAKELEGLAEAHMKNARAAVADAQAELAAARSRQQDLASGKIGAHRGGGRVEPDRDNALAKSAAAAEEKLKAAQARLDEINGLLNGDTKPANKKYEGAGSLKTPKKSADSYDYGDLHDAAQQRLADLQNEQAALGMTTEAAAAFRFEQEAMSRAKERDITLTPQQRAELQQLAAQYGRVSGAIEQTRASQQKMQEMQQELGNIATNSITGLVDGTKSLNDVLADTLELLAQLLLKAALLGEGPLAGGGSSGGLIGTLMGGVASLATGGGIGLFADGGVMTPQGPRKLKRYASGGMSKEAAIFGEAGPEAAVPLPDGRRIPVDMRVPDTSKMAGTSISTATTNVSVAPTLNIDATGSTMSEDQIRAIVSPMLAAHSQQIVKSVPGIVNKARSRMTQADKARY